MIKVHKYIVDVKIKLPREGFGYCTAFALRGVGVNKTQAKKIAHILYPKEVVDEVAVREDKTR